MLLCTLAALLFHVKEPKQQHKRANEYAGCIILAFGGAKTAASCFKHLSCATYEPPVRSTVELKTSPRLISLTGPDWSKPTCVSSAASCCNVARWRLVPCHYIEFVGTFSLLCSQSLCFAGQQERYKYDILTKVLRSHKTLNSTTEQMYASG
jgi:hypothetical protein